MLKMLLKLVGFAVVVTIAILVGAFLEARFGVLAHLVGWAKEGVDALESSASK